jgi:choline dehydrogenase-like flavoprotein
MKTNANRTVSPWTKSPRVNLKVYGIENLRIADGSIIARVTTQPYGPCAIISERAGEIQKADHKLTK